MTYARFHLVFTLPWVIAGLAWQAGTWWTPGPRDSTLITLAIVYAFTCPWDNWAVARGIWGFPEGRYLFRIHHLPVEEYAFFGLQSLLVIAAVLGLEPWLPTLPWHPARPAPFWPAGVALAWIAAGLRLWRWPGRFGRPAYAFHLLFWMVPILLLQFALAADVLLPRLPVLGLVTGAIGGYLTLADLAAVRWGLWHFDERQITGPKLAGVLPWEEAVFFLLTSSLVANSFVMFRQLLHELGGNR